VPGVIANALIDPFLMDGCFPHEEVAQNPLLELTTPAHGAHVGLLEPGPIIWSERLVMHQLATCA
jgi:predicted alpha/beta-fold hydrolase